MSLAAGLAVGPAKAAEEPLFGPPPAWVDIAPTPPAPTEDATALQVLLDDHQTRFDPKGDTFYIRRVLRIAKPEGLAAVKSLGTIWSPATEGVTFHTLSIVRDGKVIDLLADRKAMLVLRRETNLEQASLDGRITASRQVDGLQVGDILDFAYTKTRNDPVMQGHSFGVEQLGLPGLIGRYRVSISWPKGEPVTWKTTPGFGDPTLSSAGGRVALTLDKSDVLAPKAPIGAPLRFRRVGLLEATSFKDWNEVSKLMAPLFAKASELAADSPIRAETQAIARATSDPRARAFLALQLVENKTRYFFLGMGEGGYVPAAADDTWARRFGDCKAKTALLLAILSDLGVQAEPVLVNLTAGDGIDELPPALAAFNHVLVRATIDGRSYWLDGTRTGDTNPESMHAPPYLWGLPVRAAGAPLEKIVEPQITVPTTSTVIRLDASKGLEELASAKITITFSGIYATQMRATVAQTPRADLERGFRQGWSNAATGMEIEQVNWRDEPARDLFIVEMSGTDDMDWRLNPDLGVREFRIGQGTAPRPFPKRDPGPNQDAPFAVPYPSFVRARTEIVLPGGGKGFIVRGPTGVARVGGFEIASQATLQGDLATFTVDQHSITREISAQEAEAANHQIRKLRDVDSLVRAPPIDTARAASPAS